MRILRTLMLLTVVTVLLPSPPEDSKASRPRQASKPHLIGSATLAFADAVSFCDRQPQVCQTAGYVAGKLQAKAKYSVRLIYEWASESTAEPQVSPLGNVAAADPLKTGSAGALKRTNDGQSSL